MAGKAGWMLQNRREHDGTAQLAEWGDPTALFLTVAPAALIAMVGIGIVMPA